jgi:TonB family protein
LDKEAIEVVSRMPKWKPGMLWDSVVPTAYTLPIHFRLDETTGDDRRFLAYLEDLDKQRDVLYGSRAQEPYLARRDQEIQRLTEWSKTDSVAYLQAKESQLAAFGGVKERAQRMREKFALSAEEEEGLYHIFRSVEREKLNVLDTVGVENFIAKCSLLQLDWDRIALEGELKIRDLLAGEKYRQYFVDQKLVCDSLCTTTHPQFNGDINVWISSNMNYPSEAVLRGAEDKVMVTIVIEKDGSVSEAEVSDSMEEQSLDEEAIRLVKEMPNWIPGQCKDHNRTVRMKHTLPVTFRLW